VRAAIDDFNLRVKEARRQLLGGPPVVTQLRDPITRCEPGVNGASNVHTVPLKSTSDSVLKRQHWVGADDAVGAARLDREADRRTEPRHQRRRGGTGTPSRRPRDEAAQLRHLVCLEPRVGGQPPPIQALFAGLGARWSLHRRAYITEADQRRAAGRHNKMVAEPTSSMPRARNT